MGSLFQPYAPAKRLEDRMTTKEMDDILKQSLEEIRMLSATEYKPDKDVQKILGERDGKSLIKGC